MRSQSAGSQASSICTMQAGLRDRLVLDLQRVGERVDEFLVALVVLVLAADLDARRRRRRQERVGDGVRAERRFQQLDLALQRCLTRVANRLAAHPVANSRGLRGRARRLLEQRAAGHRLRVEVVELLPILARAQQRDRALRPARATKPDRRELMNVTQLPPFVSSPSLTMSVPAATLRGDDVAHRRAQRRVAGLAFPGLERARGARRRASSESGSCYVARRSYDNCGYALRMAVSEMTS